MEKPFPVINYKIIHNRNQLVNNENSNIVSTTSATSDEFQLKEVMLIDGLWTYSVKKSLNKIKIRINTNNRVLGLKFFSDNFKSWK